MTALVCHAGEVSTYFFALKKPIRIFPFDSELHKKGFPFVSEKNLKYIEVVTINNIPQPSSLLHIALDRVLNIEKPAIEDYQLFQEGHKKIETVTFLASIPYENDLTIYQNVSLKLSQDDYKNIVLSFIEEMRQNSFYYHFFKEYFPEANKHSQRIRIFKENLLKAFEVIGVSKRSLIDPSINALERSIDDFFRLKEIRKIIRASTRDSFHTQLDEVFAKKYENSFRAISENLRKLGGKFSKLSEDSKVKRDVVTKINNSMAKLFFDLMEQEKVFNDPFVISLIQKRLDGIKNSRTGRLGKGIGTRLIRTINEAFLEKEGIVLIYFFTFLTFGNNQGLLIGMLSGLTALSSYIAISTHKREKFEMKLFENLMERLVLYPEDCSKEFLKLY